MQAAMKLLLPSVAMICTVLVTLTALVFCLGMGANASPAQLRALKLWMLGLSLLGVAGVMTGILLLRAGQPGWASLAAITPSLILGIIFLVAVTK
jgi:hypothetical protein